MKKILVLVLFLSVYNTWSQKINQYKYAIIPSKFSFLKEENQYNLNVLSKLFMQKYGFESYLDNDTIPNQCKENVLNKVFLDIDNKSNLFTTKVKVVLKDFNGSIIAISPEGISRDKEYNRAYNEALRMAFNNFQELKSHRYIESATEQTIKITDAKPIQSEKVVTENSLIVKPTQTGYTVTNQEGTTIFILQKTSQNNVFIAEKDNHKGVFLKNNGAWFFEYYVNEQLVIEPVAIQFQ